MLYNSVFCRFFVSQAFAHQVLNNPPIPFYLLHPKIPGQGSWFGKDEKVGY